MNPVSMRGNVSHAPNEKPHATLHKWNKSVKNRRLCGFPAGSETHVVSIKPAAVTHWAHRRRSLWENINLTRLWGEIIAFRCVTVGREKKKTSDMTRGKRAGEETEGGLTFTFEQSLKGYSDSIYIRAAPHHGDWESLRQYSLVRHLAEDLSHPLL